MIEQTPQHLSAIEELEASIDRLQKQILNESEYWDHFRMTRTLRGLKQLQAELTKLRKQN